MFFPCICGWTMTNVASPNDIEHVLLSDRVSENLENLVDQECATVGSIDSWPEHWEESGAIDVWRCPVCERLYFNATGDPSEVVVYKIERKGLSNNPSENRSSESSKE